MAGTDFLHLDPSAAPPGGLTAWLCDAVRAAVQDGRLTAGDHLPPTRALAGELGVSRGVVVEAYRRLADEGLVLARRRTGTVVAALPTGARPLPAPPAARPAHVPRPALPVPAALLPPDVELDLSPGVPDLSAFPRAAWLRAEREVLAGAGSHDLGYGDPQGSAPLRREVVGWLARHRGVRADPDDVLVVAGVAQAIALVCQVLRARGARAMAVEDPGSRGAREEVAHWGLDPVPVAVDADGVDVAALAASGARAALLTPAHQFPTGVLLAPQRRRDLLAWAAGGGLVLEDDYDAEHRYDRPPVPALQPSAPDRVAHCGSTSKTLAPGMRLGWLVPPRHLLPDLVAARHASDLGSPALAQLVLARLLASGAYERHLRLVRGRQRARRDAVVAAAREHLPATRVEGVAAGLHVLLLLPEGVDDVDATDRARQEGVLVQPLSWHRVRPGPPGLVLGYAAQPPDRLREAVRRLARALPAAVSRGGGPAPAPAS
ncbi:PLP-dependent aminotransferase family protein [Vallicoccus soli]|uniref:PLP-dependent aminotransferase family protein n=1 Tax=Vallicoccus soli TaxID=2339232 RepID=A0A3A3YZ33_9ACTN|nr:PLP-dependent aminotransferase family protein [Vallicoccus soli]RJK96010.1 PLP-dependent aminotransferase family protein [Vallicoccus soli]